MKIDWTTVEAEYQTGRMDFMAGITYAHYESDAWKSGWLAAKAESAA